MRGVLAAGLTPALGLFHKGRSNAFALADDLIEPFRPVVDYVVATLNTPEIEVNKTTRLTILKACVGEFGEQQKTTPTIMTEFAQHYGQYVEGKLDKLEVPVFKPRVEAKS